MSNEYVCIEDYQRTLAERDEFKAIVERQREELTRLRSHIQSDRAHAHCPLREGA